jgi:hypothetical protein
MPTLTLHHTMAVPSAPAREAAAEILGAIASKSGDWTSFALYVNLDVLGLPNVGFIAIPITIAGVEERTEPRHEIALTIAAERIPEAFPRFTGAMGVEPADASSSTLWLDGSYDVPLKHLGAFVNSIAGHTAAESALRNFVTDIAGAVTARVERKEAAQARYRLMFDH